ncbi:XRE family transcriptional regulator [Leucobacter zeae]|nr:XRE family transcriptional regulator [Leucobacter zeae]
MHCLAVIRTEVRSTEPVYSRTPSVDNATRACRAAPDRPSGDAIATRSSTSALFCSAVSRNAGEVARIPSAAAKLVGSRIRERRLDLRLTQDQLAHDSGIDPSNLRAYESGRGIPNVYTVVRLSRALLLTDPGELLAGLTPEHFEDRGA